MVSGQRSVAAEGEGPAKEGEEVVCQRFGKLNSLSVIFFLVKSTRREWTSKLLWASQGLQCNQP